MIELHSWSWYLTNEFDRRAMVTWKCQGFYPQWSVLWTGRPRNSADRIRKARIGTVVASRIIRSLRNAIFETVQHARIHSINETGFQLIRIDPRYRDRFTQNRAIFVNVHGLKCLLNLWGREIFDNGLLWN